MGDVDIIRELIKTMPEPYRTSLTQTMDMFDKFKTFHDEISKMSITKNLKSESEAIQVATAISVLCRTLIIFILNPFKSKITPLGEMIGSIGDKSYRNKMVKGYDDKLANLYAVGHNIMNNVTPANDLPFHKKFNGEHENLHKYIDSFIEDIYQYTKTENDDDIKKTVCSLVIYMLSVIRHCVYCTFENPVVNIKAYTYINQLTELLGKDVK